MSGALADLLAGLCPTADETALLEACLHVGAPAEESWRRWWTAREAAGVADRRGLAAARTLMPLLARSLASNRLAMPADVRAAVHAAALREERRAERLRRIAAEALAVLEPIAAPAVVRGVALAATAYPSWALRHCHDLDLLLERERLEAAATALIRAGLARPDPARPGHGERLLRHASGLRLALHTRAFASPHHPVSARALVGSGWPLAIDGQTTRMPAPAATLVHVLGHATYSQSRRTLRWVTDAWYLIDRWPDLDWSDVAQRLDAYRLALPASRLLAYVAGLGAAVPPAALAAVQRRAAAADRTEEDIAIGAALASAGGDVQQVWRAASWPARRRLARWALAPSAAYLRGELGPAGRWGLPIAYAYRPLRFARRRLAGVGRPARM